MKAQLHAVGYVTTNTIDEAYCHDPLKYAAMTTEEALMNADSHSFTAVSLYAKKLLTNGSPELSKQKKASA